LSVGLPPLDRAGMNAERDGHLFDRQHPLSP
jgi:hypothetical protein